MGNQITAIAPTQVLPLESYFNDLPDYNKPTSLGSTRFMKVARSRYRDETEVVVKVFAKHDPSLKLDAYEKKLYDIQLRLHDVANTLPFQAFWNSDKAAFLVRQHIHYNLYDRISTAPFLCAIEKKWIVFQLLKALEECHSHNKKVFHGDIKTENVLLTSWDWVLLTDFATFKPTLLPADNPADYGFFFDTSRRRTCYIAPERLVYSADFSPYSSLSNVSTVHRKQHYTPLTSPMDIFSLGCVIAELFLDGQQLFDLSQLLDYRTRDYSPDPLLKKIADKHVRRLVRHMIQHKPADRWRAEKYLGMFKGLIFPEYFDNFLHNYFRSFSTSQHTPDQSIKKLYSDIEAILANLFLNSKSQDRESGYGDVLIIVLATITAHMRAAQFAASKLQVLEMMKSIAQYIRDEHILERIVPYLHLLIKDSWSSVRAEAIRTLSFCLSLIRRVPTSDFNLFPEYILPVMRGVARDIDVRVRIALAECVADLALSAHRFLELAQLHMNQEVSEETSSYNVQYQVQGSYDSELLLLQDTFQNQIIVHLLSDSDSNVKKAFLKHSAGKLCIFFGSQKAKEIILSHMITFLNDKSNWELHTAFFEAIVDVAAMIGPKSLDIVEALLQQGLSDSEESVICSTITSMTQLCKKKLFNPQFVLSVLKQITPFLVHPNIWARYGAVGFITAAAQQMDEVDTLCYIVPEVKPFLWQPIVNLDDQLVLLTALVDPIPRPVLDYILKQPSIEKLFELLMEVQMRKRLLRTHTSPQKVGIGDIEGPHQPTFRKMITLGFQEEHEAMILALKEHLLKQHSNRQQSTETEPQNVPFKGVVDLKELSFVKPRSILLEYESQLQPLQPSGRTRKTGAKSQQQQQQQLSAHLNEEWGLMFSDESAFVGRAETKAIPRVSPPSSSKFSPHLGVKGVAVRSKSLASDPSTIDKGDELSRSSEDVSEGDFASTKHRRVKSETRDQAIVFDNPPSLVRVEQTTCMENLISLLEYKRELYTQDMQGMDRGYLKFPFYQIPSGWSPKGQLVAHIHDHTGAVNKIIILKDTSLFASFSDDGTTKVWDVKKMDGLHVINKPRLTYNQQGGEVKTGCFCMSNQSIASASTNGTIHVYSIDSAKQKNSKSKQVVARNLDPTVYGSVVEMNEFTSGGQNVLCLVTNKGRLCGLDLRSSQLAWDLKNNPKYGLMLSMAVDPFQNWVALGTSLGYHVIWDMRFQLPIRNWQHDGHGEKHHIHRIYQLSAHPGHHSSLISAASCNNEVSVWDMETATRRRLLWASPKEPFSPMTDDPLQHHSVRAMYTCIVGSSPVVLTGGTDRYIRLWTLPDPTQCACIVRPDPSFNKIHTRYSSQVIEGVEVIRELKSISRSTPTKQGPDLAHSEAQSHAHVDYITAVAVIPYKSHHCTQQFIVSGGHDGVIKLWK